MSKKFKQHCVIVLCSTFLSACSVGMAINGQKEPDASVVKIQAHRSDIEVQFGAPVQLTTHDDGKATAVYAYEVGRESSAGRAIAHGVMDVLTIGIWEVVGTPVEALKGDKLHLIITYDQKDRLVSATRKKADY